ncbi:uncharacterized protein LOC103277764 [Anolis carolinensis]|uniref:uncharacterized protein LOC103277764 n=1 Tax=Anolis carolinensis TaxID=28377 RepID=UPI0004624B91|nr:PREDICTED: uncharacterized protein LOC103277764 [Anolis carolinensis]|eukprot:XP_008102170.1 PREDICTED: uncharacterized protein LOC103277764 [Anolis carolinensis]
MPNQKTGVWHHYNETSNGKKIVGQCKYCGQTYANNATRMKRHLTICKNCPERTQSSYRKLLQLSTGTTSGKSLLQELIEFGSSSETTNLPNIKTENAELPAFKKREAEASFSGQQDTKYTGRCSGQFGFLAKFADKMSKEEQERADETLARAIFASGMPLSLTENQYWREHYKVICPSYKLPSGYHLSHNLLDSEYSRVQKLVVQRISQVKLLTLLANVYVDIQETSLLSIMFATPEPSFLKAIPTESANPTGEYIANLLSEEIERTGPLRVQALVTGKVSNMEAAQQVLKAKYPHLIIFGCLADGLNLLVKDIVNVTAMKKILTNCKAIVEAFNNHHVINQTLKRLQKKKQGEGTALFLPSKTRWNFATKCLDNLLRTRDCLQCALLEDEVARIIPLNVQKQIGSDAFWVQVQGAFDFLLPISEAIKELQEDKSTLSDIPEIFRKLNEKLTELLPSSPLSKEHVTVVKQVLIKTADFCSHPVQLAANLLDPHYCGNHLSECELSSALNAIMEQSKIIPNTDEITVMTDIAEYRAKEKLWGQELIWQASENLSPLTWWKGYCSTRQLSKIAIKIFSIPPTVTSCEQSWKDFNSVTLQNRLTNERCAKVASLSQNLLVLQKHSSQTTLVKK